MLNAVITQLWYSLHVWYAGTSDGQLLVQYRPDIKMAGSGLIMEERDIGFRIKMEVRILYMRDYARMTYQIVIGRAKLQKIM